MCLQALSEEEPLGHCHGSSDNPEVCRCGHQGLSESTSPSPSPFFPVIFLLKQKQKQKPIFNIYYQNSGLKNAYQKLYLKFKQNTSSP